MLPIEVQRSATPKTKPATEGLGFGKYFTDHIFRMDYSPERGWHQARIVPYGPLELDPGSAVFHYAQAVFDGSKVFRGTRDGQLRAFRVLDHSKRLATSAERLAMPPVPPEVAREAIEALVKVDEDWVPSAPGTALYVRPVVMAAESFLGVRPADRYLFFIVLSPVGSYFSGGAEPVRIWVEQQHTRAAPGGLGGAKAAANYAAGLQASVEAKKRGYAQVLWLDALEHRYIEEVGTMNLFMRIGDEVITPPLEGTFLPGITRESVLTLLRDWGMKVSERKLSIDELREAQHKGELREVFGTGTAAVISPVGALGFREGQLVIGNGKVGELSQRLYDAVTGIQYGTQPDRHGWMSLIK